MNTSDMLEQMRSLVRPGLDFSITTSNGQVHFNLGYIRYTSYDISNSSIFNALVLFQAHIGVQEGWIPVKKI